MAQEKIVRIANGQGFWGDSLMAPIRLIEDGPIDYLTLDYLAEITMSVLQKQRQRKPESGYATDFIDLLKIIMPQCQQKGIKILCNAGGVNPRACVDAIKSTLQEMGMSGIKIAMADGDDLLPQIHELIDGGEPFTNLDNGGSISEIRDRITSANAYTGAEPLVEALKQGADIIVTGRTADPSLVLAPLMYEFGWAEDDYDKKAAGTIIGHLLECGAQSTGGNFTDWRDVPDFAHIGYPIAEVSADGSFVLTKHEGSGGLVNEDTVASQLLYELGDPENFLSPDCTSDFTSIQLEQVGENRVRASGIKGRAPTDSYKVSMSFANGYRVLGQLTFTGPDAVAKAELGAEIIFERCAMYGKPIPEDKRFVEVFGNAACYKGAIADPVQPSEVLLRVGAKSHDREQLEILGREIAPLVTAGPIGVTGYAGSRARPTEIIGYWPTLVKKSKVTTRYIVEEI
ncbi:DUF1446 domain-containing protein [Spongiibacter sp. KMU-158]|uniref:DUF1446 domain-containing protein n=1 Tax=Spongiibacter pelagi TaxID=2760804 RepID=A0A927C2N9_9GAMM|nr:acyclic terpene utilization AtuA family protein [Spongiibacter pelagi]MBD2860188.1 DUF1446 domain-containing protein [Spongiibacter pelagi]